MQLRRAAAASLPADEHTRNSTWTEPHLHGCVLHPAVHISTYSDTPPFMLLP